MSPSRLQAKYTFTVLTYKTFNYLAMAYCSILMFCHSLIAPADSSWWTPGSSLHDPCFFFFFFGLPNGLCCSVYVLGIPCWPLLLFLIFEKETNVSPLRKPFWICYHQIIGEIMFFCLWQNSMGRMSLSCCIHPQSPTYADSLPAEV